MDTNKMREQFEAWVLREFPEQSLARFTTGEYQGFTVEHCWKAWQASREDLQVSPISPEASALMQRIDDEERGQALRAEVFVRESGRASISALQRHFKIGYWSACRLMDRLVADGVVSPIDSDGRRQVLPKVAP